MNSEKEKRDTMEQTEALREALEEADMQLEQLNACRERLMQTVPGGAPDLCRAAEEDPYAAYLELMAQRREPVQDPRVVYQGEPGAYSEMAARNFFGGNVRATGLWQFEDTFLALERGDADYAVLPVENSCTGAIRQVYDLLEQYSCFCVGETAVPVEHALMALPGTRLENITTVYSHEQGFLQCESFLSRHPGWKQVAQADTAGSARMVAELGDPHKAAICSALAAEIYGLEILQEKVNSEAFNTTRFFVLSPRAELREHRNKICISMSTIDNPGVLQSVLTVLSAHKLKLLHLESRLVPGHSWTYMLFPEFSGELMTPRMDAILRELSLFCPDLRVLGNFHSDLLWAGNGSML